MSENFIDGVDFHNSDFSLRKMRLISNSLCYGPEPEPNDEIEQRLTITSNGRVWLSRYRYGMGTDSHELYEKNSFRISLESAKPILRVVSDYFGKEYEPYYVTDVGYWNLLLTDTNGQKYRVLGSLSYNSELGLGGLSEYIRMSIYMLANFEPDGRVRSLKRKALKYERQSITLFQSAETDRG